MLETMPLIHSLSKQDTDLSNCLGLIITVILYLAFLLGPTAPLNDTVCTVVNM
jgi:hypothetical protein